METRSVAWKLATLIHHFNPPTAASRGNSQRADPRELTAKSKRRARIRPAPPLPPPPSSSSRRSSGLDTGGLDLWPPLLGLATSRAFCQPRAAQVGPASASPSLCASVSNGSTRNCFDHRYWWMWMVKVRKQCFLIWNSSE